MTSIYFIEVVIAFVSGYALNGLWKAGRQADWLLSSLWRRASCVAGWVFGAAALLAWIGWVYVMVANLLTAINPSMPKPPAILYFVIGALLYIFFIGFARSAFDAASGSAKSDIDKRLGL